jgi:hypothetical protein
MIDPATLKLGARYLRVRRRQHGYRRGRLVVHEIAGVQRYPRVSLMSYMGPAEHAAPPAGLWNAWTKAGTQELPWAWIVSAREVRPGPARRSAE